LEITVKDFSVGLSTARDDLAAAIMTDRRETQAAEGVTAGLGAGPNLILDDDVHSNPYVPVPIESNSMR